MKESLEKVHKQPWKQRWTHRPISFPKQASAMLDLRVLKSVEISFRLKEPLDYLLFNSTVSTKSGKFTGA